MDTSTHPRIVLGVDQTPVGYAALRVAVGMARSRSQPLCAVRATPTIATTGKEYIEQAFAEALGSVPADVHLQTMPVFDNAPAALARVADDPRDLIVVGNDGHGTLRAIWSGSVGRALISLACCPILVVPGPEMSKAARRAARKLAGGHTDVWAHFEAEKPQKPDLPGRPFQDT